MPQTAKELVRGRPQVQVNDTVEGLEGHTYSPYCHWMSVCDIYIGYKFKTVINTLSDMESGRIVGVYSENMYVKE